MASLLVAFVGVHLGTLTRYPLPSCDEAHYSSTAAGVLLRGQFGNDLTGRQDTRATTAPSVGRLHSIGVSLMYRLLGINLFAARSFALLGYFVGGLGVYLAGRMIFGKTTGAIAAAFFLLSWIGVMHGHSGRADIWAAAGGIVSFLLLHVALKKGQARWAALAGLAPALTIDFHLNGVHFLFASGVIAVAWGLRRRAWGWLTAFGMAAAFGLLFWYVGHYGLGLLTSVPSDGVLDYPARTARLALLPKFAMLANWWWRQYWVGTRYELLPQGVYFAVGVIALLIRRETAGRILVLYTALSALSFGLILQVQADYYRIVWMPLIALVAAAGVQTIAENIRSRWPLNARWSSLLPAALAAPLLGMYLLSDAYLLYKFRDVSYEAMISRFEAVIPAGSRVAAEATWWYGLGSKYDFLDNILFDEGTQRLGSQTMEEGLISVLKKWQFDYVIYDGRIGCYSDPFPASLALDRVLPEQCSAILTIEDKWFGEQTVYRCSSNAAHSP